MSSVEKVLSENQLFKIIMDEIFLIRKQLKEHTELFAKIREKLAGHTVRIATLSAAVAIVVTAFANWIMNR